jgi:hypothetical protein
MGGGDVAGGGEGTIELYRKLTVCANVPSFE